MNHLDDNELIDGLQAGLSRRAAAVHAPAGLANHARRLARRRTTTRAVGVGVPVLAAAGVATGLLAGSGRPTATAPSTPSAHAPVLHDQETAYIVKRVKAAVADTDGGTLIQQYEYASGEVSSHGALVNLGAKVDDLYAYAAPDGSEYIRNILYQTDGRPYLTAINVFTPDGTGKQNDNRTIINPVNHTYSQTNANGISVSDAPAPNLNSSPSQVQQALQSGHVIQQGMATVNGTEAIVLSITLPRRFGAILTLYVDAHTYQPLRTVEAIAGHPALLVADWMPPTPDNIAQAKDDSIPSGYTKVNKTY